MGAQLLSIANYLCLRQIHHQSPTYRYYVTIFAMTISQNMPQPHNKVNWFRKNALAIFASVFVVTVTVALFLLQDKIKELGNYGYLGAFLISLLTNATIILPMPSLILLFPLGAAFNPVYVGIAAGFGGAIGEMTAYVAGYSGRGLWKDNPGYLKAVTWLKKWGMLIVFLFAVSPMPLDLMGLASGNLRLPAWKFFVPALPAKIIKYIVLAYVGAWGWGLFISDPIFRTNLYFALGGLIVTAGVVILALFLERWTWNRSNKSRD
jgi:membrane protein YqaA with SNARE-associated domain